MTYTPTEDDPVLVIRNGAFGFNPLNPKMREGFWANVEKCRALDPKGKGGLLVLKKR